MQSNHLFRRRSHYYFVCRVPNDLLHFFPKPTIWKSLKTTDTKHAVILGTSWEFRTQQLFMQLRTGMLDPHLIDHLIAQYLQAGINNLEAKAYNRPYKAGEIETMLDFKSVFPATLGHPGFPDMSSLRASRLRERIQTKDTSLTSTYTQQLTDIAKKKYSITLDANAKKELGIRVLQCEKQLHEIDSAVQRGELSTLELLKEKVERTKRYIDLKTVITKYHGWYATAKPGVKPGTRDDMKAECALLQELFGCISIDSFNTVDSITHLKNILLKFPKNRLQRYGAKRSIADILKNETDYEIICLRTANEYIKRAKAIVDLAIKDDMLDKANKWIDETFDTDKTEETKRRAYDGDDIERLVDALCTKDLWRYNPPKPERFWIALIALFHGLRLSNITGLTKNDIRLTKSDIWVFRVRFGKTKSTVKDYPIHDCLLLLGFLEWVESLDRQRLFQDSSTQISKWWNRVDRDKDGNVTNGGFEYAYITKDPSKCLHSLRHYYAGEVYNASQDYKATAEALGHSLGGRVTNRYIGDIRTQVLKDLSDKLKFDVDINRLEARAQELFGVNLSTAPTSLPAPD